MTWGQTGEREFEQRARFAVIWQDLVTPARAILGYQEIIVEEAQRLRLFSVAPYLEKVLAAALSLSSLVDGLQVRPTALQVELGEIAGLQARLRHDLRTPLNAIIGYSEMVVEDIESVPGTDALRSDLGKLLAQARQLLDRIDGIVDLTGAADLARTTDEMGSPGNNAAIAGLLRTLRPDGGDAKAKELGRILIVDDNEANRDLLCRRLTHEGHEVRSAQSGEQALAILGEESFDLILLDLIMPEMNGIEVLQRLKSEGRWHSIPVIMISGLSETDAVIRCIENGAEDYLTKPFDIILLRARIDACLERKRWRKREKQYLDSLRAEKERSEQLLRNILPEPIVTRLNQGETLIADRFECASILFADIVDFTPAAALMAPANVVSMLDHIFSQFDSLAAELGVEKIKTIGDAYMAAAGLPEARPDHAEIIVSFAIGMLDILDHMHATDEKTLRIRIGIHSGPVVAGIIGRHRFIYDVWGDTVNVASRLESQGVAGRIQVSQRVQDAVSHVRKFEARGTINLKGRGATPTFLLVHPASSRTSRLHVSSAATSQKVQPC